MSESLDRIIQFLQEKPELTGYSVREEGKELHLSKGSESFVRLIPTGKKEVWRMEHFHNQKRWEHVDCTCSLDECLDFLSANPHYLFWEG
ncbi:MAG: hypothetical protein A2X84_04435 [Desulfuromonadaceae bacterium GWC2_58_13]|nr:MAG: hypothetical protein A2X84_04435 [Desulfuromonadaceae bacterium GWC2_58_13]